MTKRMLILAAGLAGALAAWSGAAVAEGVTIGFGSSTVVMSTSGSGGQTRLPPDVGQKVKDAADHAKKLQAQQKAAKDLEDKIKVLVKGIEDEKKKLASRRAPDAAKSKDAADQAAKLAALIQKDHERARQQMQKVAAMAAAAQKAGTAAEANKALSEHAKLKAQLDSMSQSNEMQMLRLQQTMERQQQMMQMLSNIMKQMHDTQKNIIANIK